jgi:uncharacterized membrane protein YfcA
MIQEVGHSSMLGSIDPLYSLSGFFVGLLVGQTGMGGGALMTPLMILLFGINPATAVGTDLLYASATKAVGTLVHGLNHTVQWRIVALLAMGSVPATALTLFVISKLDLSGRITSSIIGTVLGVLLLLTSLSLFFRRQFLAFTGTRLLAIRPRQTTLLTVTTGAVLGVLVTISSVGAGARCHGVTVALSTFADGDHRRVRYRACGATYPGGRCRQWFLGSVDRPLLASLLTGSVPGIILGSYISAHVPDAVLRPILATTLLVVGGRPIL